MCFFSFCAEFFDFALLKFLCCCVIMMLSNGGQHGTRFLQKRDTTVRGLMPMWRTFLFVFLQWLLAVPLKDGISGVQSFW